MGTSNTTAATASSTAICSVQLTRTCPILPRKYAVAGRGVARRRLSPPSSRSTAIEIARFWKLVSMTPVATIPGRKYCANGTCPLGSSMLASSCPNTVAKIASMITG